jgi:hypothetical protein
MTETKEKTEIKTEKKEAPPPVATSSAGVALNELERRQTTRQINETSMLNMRHPALVSDEAVKAYIEARKRFRKSYDDTLLMLTTDVNRLLWALKEVCMATGRQPYDEFDKAVKAVSIPSQIENLIDSKASKEAEKAAKAGKEIPGQKKLKSKDGKLVDDGSTAEAASDVISKKFDRA